jgi:2-dehydro-3-deoxy-D-gluconate 5-dehydrogenase
MDNLFSLDGRTALVTGARHGLGAAMAVGLAKAGADVVLLGHGGNFAIISEEIETHGRQATVIDLDLAEPDRVFETAQGFFEHHRVDILVNNAGIIRRADAVEHSLADFRAVHAVNVESLFELTRAAAAPMIERRAGKIINIASVLTFQGGVRVSGYTASKHAVAGLTKAWANELAPHNIQVNAIAPGYFITNNTGPLRADPQRYQEVLERIPAGRWGDPIDLVGTTVFLASAASDYVNGHILAVDGGWLSR